MSIKVVDNQATCQRLMKMLIDKGYTPTDIKEKLHLQSVQCVYKWYATARGKGSKSMPSLDNMLILSDLLGMTINDIIVYNKVDF